MEWLVRLSGDVDTLEELAKICISPELFVGKVKDFFVLKTNEFKGLNNKDAVFKESINIISIINGGIKILGFNKNVMAEQVIKEDDEGIWHYYVPLSVGSVSGGSVSFVHSKVTLKEAEGCIKEESQVEPILKWFLMAKNNEDVARVLRFLSMTNYEWTSNFYKIIDIIKGDIGDISKRGWVTGSDLRRFKGSVNNPDVIGDIARHGKSQRSKRGKVMKNPMSFYEAKAFINNIVVKWLSEKS